MLKQLVKSASNRTKLWWYLLQPTAILHFFKCKLNTIPNALRCLMKADRSGVWMFISGWRPCLHNPPRPLPIKGVWNGALSLARGYTEHRGRFVCKAARVILSNQAGGGGDTHYCESYSKNHQGWMWACPGAFVLLGLEYFQGDQRSTYSWISTIMESRRMQEQQMQHRIVLVVAL